MAAFSKSPAPRPMLKVASSTASTAPSTAGSKPSTMPLVGKAAPANISQYMPPPTRPRVPQPSRPSLPETSRGGAPITFREAPGYRGIGTPTMPSSLTLGAKKGGVVTTRKISTATKSKKQSSW